MNPLSKLNILTVIFALFYAVVSTASTGDIFKLLSDAVSCVMFIWLTAQINAETAHDERMQPVT